MNDFGLGDFGRVDFGTEIFLTTQETPFPLTQEIPVATNKMLLTAMDLSSKQTVVLAPPAVAAQPTSAPKTAATAPNGTLQIPAFDTGSAARMNASYTQYPNEFITADSAMRRWVNALSSADFVRFSVWQLNAPIEGAWPAYAATISSKMPVGSWPAAEAMARDLARAAVAAYENPGSPAVAAVKPTDVITVGHIIPTKNNVDMPEVDVDLAQPRTKTPDPAPVPPPSTSHISGLVVAGVAGAGLLAFAMFGRRKHFDGISRRPSRRQR